MLPVTEEIEWPAWALIYVFLWIQMEILYKGHYQIWAGLLIPAIGLHYSSERLSSLNMRCWLCGNNNSLIWILQLLPSEDL